MSAELRICHRACEFNQRALELRRGGEPNLKTGEE